MLTWAINAGDWRFLNDMEENGWQQKSIFKQVAGYKNMHLYQKSEVLILLTY